ncbi:MAG: CPCC family cysteine-rich protein [Peptostreptococcaceae bacterium]|nr:CPCC family cysteine-rich protein [Peptostreptococcaceae bacterium]
MNKEIEVEMMECPVCGAKVEPFDICDTCDWQNSGCGDTGAKGPNKMTLAEAKAAYAERFKKEAI